MALVVAGRRCLVVGGGPVAARKAATLAGCGALVHVVAPEVVDAVDDVASSGAVTVSRRRYRAGEAAGYRLVVAATGDPTVDDHVAADAEAAGVWANVAGDPDRCTFVVPAVHRDGDLTVAVSTGGASPALAAWLRTKIAEDLGPGLGTLADILDRARREVQGRGREPASVDWQALLAGPLPSLVAQGRLDEAHRLVARATDQPTE